MGDTPILSTDLQACATTLAFLCSLLAVNLSPSNAGEPAREVKNAVDRLVYAASVYDEKGMAAATKRLGGIGSKAIPSLVGLLKHHQDANVRWQAIVAIDHIGVAANDLSHSLVTATKDSDGDVRASAVTALTKIFPGDKRTLSVARTLSSDPQPFVRVRAHASLWALRRRQESIDALVQLLGSKDWMVSEEASKVLVHIGRPAIDQLNRCVNAAKCHGQVAAVRTLAEIPNLPDSAIHALSMIAQSADRRLVTPAISGLARCGSKSWPKLLGLANSTKTLQRVESLRALGLLSNVPHKGKLLLLSRTSDANPAVVLAAIETIGLRKIDEKEFINALLEKLKGANQDLRAAALVALSRMPPSAIRNTTNIESLAANESAEHLRLRAKRLLRELAK